MYFNQKIKDTVLKTYTIMIQEFAPEPLDSRVQAHITDALLKFMVVDNWVDANEWIRVCVNAAREQYEKDNS